MIGCGVKYRNARIAGDSGLCCPTYNHMGYVLPLRSSYMVLIDAAAMLGFAALLTSLAALIWSIRRKP
jgi:hypothetical protein